MPPINSVNWFGLFGATFVPLYVRLNVLVIPLNKYEISTILIMRCEQINNGMQPLIQNYEKFNNIEDIVEEELKQKKIPFIIKRNLRNSVDYWRLSDMSLH